MTNSERDGAEPCEATSLVGLEGALLLEPHQALPVLLEPGAQLGQLCREGRVDGECPESWNRTHDEWEVLVSRAGPVTRMVVVVAGATHTAGRSWQ